MFLSYNLIMKDINEIFKKVDLTMKDENIHYKDVVFNTKRKRNIIIFIFDDEVDNYFENIKEICLKLNEKEGNIIEFDSLAVNEKSGKVSIFAYKMKDFLKGFLINEIICKYDYLRFLKKKLNSHESDPKTRFSISKRMEMIISNILLFYKFNSNKPDINIKLKWEIIFPRLFFLYQNFFSITQNVFDINKDKKEKYLNNLDIGLINQILNLDPLDIFKIYEKNNFNVNNKGVIKESDKDIIINEKINIKVKSFPDSNELNTKVDALKFNLFLEKEFTLNGIWKREFKKITDIPYSYNIIDQNFEKFTGEENQLLKLFVIHTNFKKNRDCYNILRSMIDIMKYIDSEYKNLLRPLVFTIEDFLMHIAHKSIIELLDIKVNSLDKANLIKSLKSYINESELKLEQDNFLHYINATVKMTQKGKSPLLTSLLPNLLDHKNNWPFIKYFTNSEKDFISTCNLSVNDLNSFEANERLSFYIESVRFKYDLNYSVRKMTFGGINELILTLDLPDEYDETKYKNLKLLKDLLDLIGYEGIRKINELRNVVSHQDLIVNYNIELSSHENILQNAYNFLKDKNKSYTFQFNSDVDIKKDIENKIKGSWMFHNSKISQLIKLTSFINETYKPIFKRNLISDEIIEETKRTKQKTNCNQNTEITNQSNNFEFLTEILKLFEDYKGDDPNE